MPPDPLDLTRLEPRDVPSAVQVGDPWPDPQDLTLSFVKDGTPVGAISSTLFQTMNPAGRPAAWEREILRAFQTWVAVTNLNVGLVSDSGEPFGTPGDIQGDSRFGDIRVGARPLSTDTLANTAIVDWATGTWSGDVLFNAKSSFAINPPPSSTAADVYTVALHEAGHALGLDHSDDPASVMSEEYVGTRAGLSASDVAAIQSIYGGPRQPDKYEGAAGNDSLLSASYLSGSGNLSVTADLTTTSDVDYYAFTTPADDKAFTAKLQTAGLSLLTARLTVLDAAGQVVGTDSSTDPTDGDLQVKVEHPLPNATYFLRVAGASDDVFSVGRYAASVEYKATGQQTATFPKDNGTNDTPAGADDLAPWRTWGGGSDNRLYANGVIESKADVDYYRVTAPADVGADTNALVVQVIGMRDGAPALPVMVYDAGMSPVSTWVSADGSGRVLVQVANVVRGATYYIRVAGDGTDASKGNYRLTAAFTSPRAPAAPTLEIGTLTADNPTGAGTLDLSSTALFQFSLGSTSLGSGNGAQVTLEVLDATGKRVFSLTGASGDAAVTDTRYLAAGRYTVRVSLAVKKGDTTSAVRFRLAGAVLSDPIGPYDTGIGGNPYNDGPTSPPPPPPPTGTFLYTAFTTATKLVIPYSF